MNDTFDDALWACHRASLIGPRTSADLLLRWSTHPPLLEQESTDDALALPRPGLAPTSPVFDALCGPDQSPTPPPRSGGVIGTILAYGYGLVGAQRYAQVSLPRRPAASAGGLYPCTAVVATKGAGEVPAGVYAYAPKEHVLVPVRPGLRAAYDAKRAAGASLSSMDPVILFVASYWRSAWKYQHRALRYCGLDAGHGAGAIIAAARGLDAGAQPLACAEPECLVDLLGIDASSAGVMGAVGLSLLGDPSGSTPSESLESLLRPAVDGQPLQGIMLDAVRTVAHSRAATTLKVPEPREGQIQQLPWSEERAKGGPPVADCVIRRHSLRRFRRSGISGEQLAQLLACANGSSSDPLHMVVAIRNVEGVDPGVYWHDPQSQQLVAIRLGRVAEEVGAAAGQQFLAQAAAVLMPVADLRSTCDAGGPRAYLHAHYVAGLAGQNIHLAATALGLGCCPVGAFRDDDINMLAGLERDSGAVLCLHALGAPR